MHPLINIDTSTVAAFGLADDLEPFEADWHTHEKHQLLYSAMGTLRLQVQGSWWLLPPQRAAWIQAGVLHQVRATKPTALRTVYLSPALTAGIEESCRVFAVNSLAREMLLYAMRWGPDRAPQDPVANAFFHAFSALCQEWVAEARPYHLPTGESPELQRAIQHVLDRLADPHTLETVAQVAGISSRSLSRRFEREAQTTWRQFLHNARMIRAMELLSIEGAQVTATALNVGFESFGSFTQAFKTYAGETPSEYRHRISAC
jgi:AraC-like DNA-binding protein